ncbi:winged helix-turn-helix transcriptional regulator [Phaeacidiphilus oryzae]|jgi:DNA-binding HxlR family transcriptional regulator|uniref:winged helix-turn-helix transcriptional regulator n=1 Tax=Phaeacidiphilus oryzae TaxID=348818 RepID=UPI00056BFBFD|nr:helix-turn-helix domain-containing protein [Phaeacidiphilus oryzae]
MATTTAAEQRTQAKVAYDAFLAVCPSRKLLDRISNKWVTLILAALGSDSAPQAGGECAAEAGEPRAMRYSELKRLLAGVSQKMLTQTLRSLERDGLVSRTVVPTVPVTVSYELTELGLSLYEMMRGLKAWAEAHMDDVLANRETYDAADHRAPAG